jgi:hypothetical protein
MRCDTKVELRRYRHGQMKSGGSMMHYFTGRLASVDNMILLLAFVELSFIVKSPTGLVSRR